MKVSLCYKALRRADPPPRSPAAYKIHNIRINSEWENRPESLMRQVRRFMLLTFEDSHFWSAEAVTEVPLIGANWLRSVCVYGM
jgi:hypothetical protein